MSVSYTHLDVYKRQLSFLVIPVLIAGIMIFSYWVSLRYALAYYLLADHQMCIRDRALPHQ